MDRTGPAVARHLLDLLFPSRCAGCGVVGEPLCPRCRPMLRRAPLSAPPPGVDLWIAPFAYEGVARELVTGAKYHGRHGALTWLGESMAHAWEAAHAPTPDVVTWAPTSALRRRARGVDHARVLGHAVARGLGVVARPLLVRDPGPAQTDRPIAARRDGPRVRAPTRVIGTVLVVDDVATTGATLRVCARALREAGARHVVALTGARTAPPNREHAGDRDQSRMRRAST